MDIDTDVRADLICIPCDDALDDTWNICYYVLFQVCTMFLQSVIAFVHVFLEELSTVSFEGLQ